MKPSSRIDLKELAIRREQSGSPRITPKRRIVSRFVLPAALVLGFATVLAWAARDVYLPRTPVTVAPVRVSQAEIQTGGTPLFNAAGWVEPRPTPIRVAALASGVVEDLLVVEDQLVEKGEPIAELVKEDAQLARDQAQAVLEVRGAEVREAEAAVAAARVNLKIPAHLELPWAEAKAALAAIKTELSNLPHQRDRAKARRALAEYDWNTSQRLSSGEAITQLQLEQAKAEFEAAKAEVAELEERESTLLDQEEALGQLVKAAKTRLELKTDERQALEGSLARLEGAKARREQAQAVLEEADLRLSRMTIYAPASGRILNLVTQPGSLVLSGTGPMQGEDRSTVVKMYIPQQLQVRVDVRFEDLPNTGRGQPVAIRSPAVPEPLTGQVLFLTGFANIQKNTLEVKVSIDEPPDVLKPEMLVDVTYLAPETESAEEASGDQFRLFVPRSLVQREGDTAYVWLADIAKQLARRQRVSVGETETQNFLEVTDGLTPASRLIASGYEQLADGDRIQVTGESAADSEAVAPRTAPGRFPGSSTR